MRERERERQREREIARETDREREREGEIDMEVKTLGEQCRAVAHACSWMGAGATRSWARGWHRGLTPGTS